MLSETQALCSVGTADKIAQPAEDKRFFLRLEIGSTSWWRACPNGQQTNSNIHCGLLRLLSIRLYDHGEGQSKQDD